MFSRPSRNHTRDHVPGGSVTVTHDLKRWNAILTRGFRKRAARREGATARGKLTGNSQLATMHTLPEILDVFEAHSVNAIELWPANFSGFSSTPEAFEWCETKDVEAVGGLLRSMALWSLALRSVFMRPRCASLKVAHNDSQQPFRVRWMPP
jgi:hypothetical protein